MNIDLQQQLLSLARRDEGTTHRIRKQGILEDSYHPELEEIHVANARELQRIIAEHGLPGRSLVGNEGAEAVWIIIQHAISLPDFQRALLLLMREASEQGEFPPACVAYLEDRINVHEGKPQRFGTQYDWDGEGKLSPYPLVDATQVDALRASVGLSPLELNTTRLRVATGEPPTDLQAKRAAYQKWLKEVGWR